MAEQMTVNGQNYSIVKLLGRGKGGYSYLAERDGKQYVLKQIHHEPCSYYNFGNKIEAERSDYGRLTEAGLPIPQMLEIDIANERILKEYIDGPTIYDLVLEGGMEPAYLEQVRRMARSILDQIITPDMVTAEKLKAVFDYVRGRVHYTGSSNKNDWRQEAVRGYEDRRGDCFTVYSLTRALLDELQIPYMSVTRKSTATRHYWVIVNIGTGWYHYDPLLTRVHKYKCFMWTNQQCKAKPYFWRFHEENFPAIATERFDYDTVVQMERDGLLP